MPEREPPGTELGRLAVLSLRILSRRSAGVPGPGAEPDLRGRVREIPRPQGGADGIGVSWLPAFMWRANKTWRGVRVEAPRYRPRAGLHHARPHPLHHAAVRQSAGCHPQPGLPDRHRGAVGQQRIRAPGLGQRGQPITSSFSECPRMSDGPAAPPGQGAHGPAPGALDPRAAGIAARCLEGRRSRLPPPGLARSPIHHRRPPDPHIGLGERERADLLHPGVRPPACHHPACTAQIRPPG